MLRRAAVKWAILFDLDDTLVLTWRLADLRRRRAWPAVYRAFDQTSLPPGTREFVGQISKLGELAVVTTSPRSYAERLLRHHRVDIPVVVAYHDTKDHKPDPAPIVEAARRLGTAPQYCVHIGDTNDDIVASRRAGVAGVKLMWSGQSPEAVNSGGTPVCRSWDDVWQAVSLLLGLTGRNSSGD